jgi:hypothetical protein
MAYATLMEWAKAARLEEPLNELPVEFLSLDQEEKVQEFARFCGSLVLDRALIDPRFEEKRPILYKKWLRSRHPCLMSVLGPSGPILAASIILPLTKPSEEEFFVAGLDAADMDRDNFTEAGQVQAVNYLLIDILAVNARYLASLPAKEADRLRGTAYRGLIRHLYEFAGTNPDMVLLCNTLQKNVAGRLKQFGFENAIRKGKRSEDFRLDLARPRPDLTADAQAAIGLLRGMMALYASR